MIEERPSQHHDDDLLTVAEGARIAQRSVRALRRAYLAGRMVAHRDGNGRGVTIRYADLLAWLTADVILPPSTSATPGPSAHVAVGTQSSVHVETGNLELLSAARRRRATHARSSAAPRATSNRAGSGSP
jgi:hypothetical protein